MEEDWTKQDRPPQLPLFLTLRLLVALLCCIKGPPAQRHRQNVDGGLLFTWPYFLAPKQSSTTLCNVLLARTRQMFGPLSLSNDMLARV
jgi:hypothetical protein